MQQPPRQIGRYAASSGRGHHGGMMLGGGGGEIGGRGAEGDDSYNRQSPTSIDNGGRSRPMAAMGTHFRCLSIQQSAIILCKRTTPLKLEKTIIANINYLV